MRKFIIFILFFLGTFLAISGDARAIQYSGAFSFPDIILSGSVYGSPSSYYDGNSFNYVNYGSTSFDAISGPCIHTSSGTSTGTYWTSGIYASEQTLGLTFEGVTGSGQFFLNPWIGSPIPLAIWNYQAGSTGGNHPDEAILCYNFNYTHFMSSGRTYLYSIDAVSIGSTMRHIYYVFTGSSEDGLEIGGNSYASPNFTKGSVRWVIPTYDYSTLSGSLYNISIMSDFLTGITAVTSKGVENPLPYYFGATSEYIQSGGSGGTTGSGSPSYNDYISECTSFLDIGCYIKGSFNFVIDTLKYYLLPNIDFGGYSRSCSGDTIGSSTKGFSYIQNLNELFGVMVPTPPPEGTLVCTIFGDEFNVHYQSMIGSGSLNFFTHYNIEGLPEKFYTDGKVPGTDFTILDIVIFIAVIIIFI